MTKHTLLVKIRVLLFTVAFAAASNAHAAFIVTNNSNSFHDFSDSSGITDHFTNGITKLVLINDDASGAITINTDAGCMGAIYTNVGATQSVGEPAGTCSSTTGYATVWYKFTAPPGGAVKISTATGAGNTLTNTRAALFSATAPNDYSTFKIIACDEDGGSGSFGSMSVLYATGLTEFNTYYIEVDKFDNAALPGTFCLTVETLTSSMLSTSNNCNSIYQTPAGAVASYDGWVSLMDDNSRLIALVKNPTGGPVNGYAVVQNVNAGAVRKDIISGEYYLNRSYTINNTVNSAAVLNVQFFFLTNELAALKAVDPAASLSFLRVTKQTASICQPGFVTANGANSELVQTGNGATNGVSWVGVNASGFSNFYIHAAKSYLTGKVFLQGAYDPSLGRHKNVTTNWANVLNTYAKGQPYNNIAGSDTAREGFGASTTGGTGQQVVHVTNLNATGPGSLYAAMGNNRTIVFDVAGTINDFSWVGYGSGSVNHLTIDGSSAPSPGITLNNNNSSNNDGNCMAFENGCHDIIVKSIRVRNANRDGFACTGTAYNIVFDHCSSSGNRDGNLDITSGAHDITVQWCIFGHSVSGPMLIAYAGTGNVTVHHCLFTSIGNDPPGTQDGTNVGERSPLVHNADNYVSVERSDLMADFRNNIDWNWGLNNGTGYGYGCGAEYGGTLQCINNFYQSISRPANAIVKNTESTLSKVYASGNVSGNSGVNPNSVSNVAVPWTVVPVTTQDPCIAAGLVLSQAGPRPLDASDAALINAVSLATCPGAVASSNYTGTETVANGFFTSAAPSTDIVDWVLLEIKNSTGSIITRRAAFVREDGQIIDLDGVSPVSLYGLTSGNYYIAIRHRNHLGIRSGTLRSFTATALGTATSQSSYDFTTAQSQAYQDPSITTNAAMAQSGGVYMMWAGNANQDQYVRAITQAIPLIPSDASYILGAVLNGNPAVTVTGYSAGDINMDGNVRAVTLAIPFIPSDFSFMLSVLNGDSNATRREHK